jgi:imidazolonepropionase
MAIATNCNPGSSPTTSPTTMMNMACHLFGMSADEALAGFTRNAAMALALDDDIGTIEVGKAADLAIWDVSHPSELSYYIGDNRCSAVIKAGEEIFRHDARRGSQWPHR